MSAIALRKATATATEPKPLIPVCTMCYLEVGNDHRMCLAEGLRSGMFKSVADWKEKAVKMAEEIEAAAKPAPAPAAPALAPAPAPAAKPVAVRRCGICREPGHTRNRCPDANKRAPTPPLQPLPPPPPPKWTHSKERSFVFPPGRYYLGDICYPMQSDKANIYDTVWGGEFGYESGIMSRNGDPKHTFAVYGTAHGDGEYKDNEGHKYPVDAGVIGFVPTHLFDEAEFKRQYGPDEFRNSLPGRILEFTQPVTFSTDGHGNFVVNAKYPDRAYIEIITDGSGSDDEEEDDY